MTDLKLSIGYRVTFPPDANGVPLQGGVFRSALDARALCSKVGSEVRPEPVLVAERPDGKCAVLGPARFEEFL